MRERVSGEQVPSVPPPLRMARAPALPALIGNRAFGALVSSGDVLARAPGPTTADMHAQVYGPGNDPHPSQAPAVTTREVDRAISETISHAPTQFAAWNGTYGWKSKWRLELDGSAETGNLTVRVRLYSTAPQTVKDAWVSAITGKWSNKFAFCVLRDTPVALPGGGSDRYAEMYPIRIAIDWVAQASAADYTITGNAAGATEGGRAGQGGTTSMTGWGTADLVDVTHEFGHILGCPEEYFTTDGVDYTAGGTKQGFRDTGGGVMNNPSGPALARNFAVIQDEAATLRGVGKAKTEIAPWR